MRKFRQVSISILVILLCSVMFIGCTQNCLSAEEKSAFDKKVDEFKNAKSLTISYLMPETAIKQNLNCYIVDGKYISVLQIVYENGKEYNKYYFEENGKKMIIKNNDKTALWEKVENKEEEIINYDNLDLYKSVLNNSFYTFNKETGEYVANGATKLNVKLKDDEIVMKFEASTIVIKKINSTTLPQLPTIAD